MLLYLALATTFCVVVALVDALWVGAVFFYAPDVKAHLQKQDKEIVQLKRDLRKAERAAQAAERQSLARYDQGRKDGVEQATKAKTAVIRAQKERIALMERYLGPQVLLMVDAELHKAKPQQPSTSLSEPDWFAESFSHRRQ